MRLYFGASALLVTILLLVFYAPVLFFGREMFVSDHTFYFEPFARLIAEAYRSGHLPLWNPYNYCGMPQIANPSPGPFYLPNFLFVALPYSKAMGLILIVHHLAAFAGAFLLVESIGWGLPAAAFCGVLMAMNGYMMSLSANYTLPGSAAWGVLALYAIVNIGRPDFARPARRYGFVVLSALAVNLTLMAGRPEVFVPMLTMISAAAGFMFLGLIRPFDRVDDWRGRGVVLAWQVGAIVLGILLAAPMMLPVYEWSKLSPRASGLALTTVLHWSVNWYDLVCMLCPQPLGDMQQPNSEFLKIVSTYAHHYPFLPSALIGPVAFSLFLLGVFDKTFRARFYMLSGFAVALCLALGKYGPLSKFLHEHMPFLSVLRYPCKLLVVVIFFVAIFGARGLHSVANDQVGPRRKYFLLALWAALIVVAGVLVFGDHYCADAIKYIPSRLFNKIGISLAYTSLIGLVVALLIAYASKLKLPAKYSAVLLIVLTAVSVFIPAFRNAPKTVAAGFYARPAAVNARLQKIVAEAGPADATRAQRFLPVYFDPLRVADGYEPRYPLQKGEAFMQYTRELLLPNTNSDSHVRAGFGYEASETKDYRTTYVSTLHKSSADKKDATDLEVARFCQITSSRYLASQITNDKGPVNLFNARRFKLLVEDQPMNYRIYETLHVLPRAYMAPSYRTISNQKEALAAINCDYITAYGGNGCLFDRDTLIELDQKLDSADDKLDFRDKSGEKASAVLTGVKLPVPGFSERAVQTLDDEQKAETKVSILRDDNEHVSLSVSTPVEGFVILNDRFYPGWHALVDTQPAVIYRANAFMRAVYVGKGQHLIEFNYEPESLRNGFYVFAFAAFVLACLMLVWLREPAWNMVTYLSTGKRS